MWKNQLSQTVQDGISAEMKNIGEFTPSKFQRKPRAIDCLDLWKAVEYRFFILYAGPAVMKGKLPLREYNLLTTLSVSMHILLSDTHCGDQVKVAYAKELLNEYVLEYIEVYGTGMVTYNTHGLIHLADDVFTFGKSLHRYSAFPFESFLGKLMQFISGPKHPVQQIVNRYEERKKLAKTVTKGKDFRKYKRMPIQRDRVFYLGNNKFAIIDQVLTPTTVNCKIINSGHDWYSQPLPSTDISYCYRATLTNSAYQVFHTRELDKEAMMIPVEDGYIFTPLLHTV